MSTQDRALAFTLFQRPLTPLTSASAVLADTTSLGRLVTSAELSSLLNIPLRTIEGWRRRRTGPPWVRAGRAVRYDVVEVADWLKRNRPSQGESS